MKQTTKMSRTTIILIILLSFSIGKTKAQTETLKYKDIFETIIRGPEAKAAELLIKFQKQDPFHANTYYQLGIIAHKWSKIYDPLTDFANLSYFTYHANLYLELSKKYLDEKEAKKNHEFYHFVKPHEGEKKADYSQIMIDLDKRINDVKIFDEKIAAIRTNYFGMVKNYNTSLSIFKSIVDKNGKLKDIYLTANDELIQQIKNIGIHYDSTLLYFDGYEKAIGIYPIMDYNQAYKAYPIETYQLDGLTKSNFLKNDIKLWNFKEWSDNVLSIINNDISKLRIDINTESKKIESLTNLMNLSKEYSNKYDYYSLDEKLAYRIGRFDFNPIILDIFNYKISNLNLTICSKKEINNPIEESNTTTSFLNKLTYYSSLVDKKQVTESNLKSCNEHLNAFNLLKYQDYITELFGDEKGVRNYLSAQNETNAKTLENSFDNLKKHVALEIQKNHSDTSIIKLKNGEIPLSITTNGVNEIGENEYFTTGMATDAKGNHYCTGYFKPTNKKTKAFVAVCNSFNELTWHKLIDLSVSRKKSIYNFSTHIVLTDNGCITMVHTRDSANAMLKIKNWIVRFDNTGKEIQRDAIGPKLIPRLVAFDDINEKILASYKGIDLSEDNNEKDTALIVYADSAGSTLWKTPIVYKGNVVNMIRSNENTIVVANYSELDYNNKQHALPKVTTNAFFAIIDKTGAISQLKTLDKEHSYFLTHAIKLNSESINLLGVKANNKSLGTLEKSKVKLQYMLMNTEGNTLYSY